MMNILVLCTGNSCRSQIAEGFLTKLSRGRAKVYSAGIDVHGVNPDAVKYMKEFAGIDISSQTSNNVSDYFDIDFDYIITVCDHAKENCPYFPSLAERIHRNFYDPSKVKGTSSDVEEAYEKSISEIGVFCREFVNQYL